MAAAREMARSPNCQIDKVATPVPTAASAAASKMTCGTSISSSIRPAVPSSATR
ncbi:MAG: hypothetical protein ABIT68_02210 [Sphingomicrobium sp.]